MFDEQKNIAYRNDFGLIELVKSGAKSTIAHGYGKTKLSAVKAIKAVIENGNIITYTPNYEKTSVDRYIIAARGKIDNADAIMGVIVKSYPATKKNSKFYLHEVTIIKEADLPSMTAPQLSVDTVNKSASNNNISQIPETVKENSNKFSLSEPVEEKDNLIAVHNIYTDKLAKSLKLGGFPMPSIAVTKADMGHENYGECSFVFDKSTIDPKVDKRNKVYGGDAWTPTYPTIEYKVSEEVIQRVKDTREHNLFGKDGKFMHCSGGAFLLPETLNVKLRSRLQRLRSADFLCGIYEFAELSVSVLAGVGGFLDGVGEVLGFISGFVNALVSLFEGGVVGTKVTLHAVENCLRIVQLYLPALGAAAVLTKGLGGIGKGRTERFDFLFLLVAISLFRT